MVGTVDDAMGERVGAVEGGTIAHDGFMRDEGIVLGLDDQHVAAKRRAGGQRAVLVR